MSGHSKWATTKRAKGATDAKRAILFTKLAKLITVAAREKGGDPTTNFSLRLAIEKSKTANMPRDNIERAIKRGTGEGQGQAIEEINYEGFFPGGTLLIVKCLTDNKNRTASEIKHVFSRFGGSLGGPNSVMWQFEKKGVIRLTNEKLAGKNLEDLELQLIDWGALDLKKEEDSLVIYTRVEDLQKISKELESLGLLPDFSEIAFVAKEKISLAPELQEKNHNLFEALDDLEDVDDYYSNLQE